MGVCCVCGRKLKSGNIGPVCAKKALAGDYPQEIKETATNYQNGIVSEEATPPEQPQPNKEVKVKPKRKLKFKSPEEMLGREDLLEDEEEDEENKYENARESKYSNLGEDIKDSARHNRAKSLIENIENGDGEKLIKRDKLLLDLKLELDENNLQSSLLHILALKQFPPKPNVPSEYKNSSDDTVISLASYGGINSSIELGEYKKNLQKNYLETFNSIDSICKKETSNEDKISEIKDLLRNQIELLRKGDRYNPLANQYVSYLNDKAIPSWTRKKNITPLSTASEVNSVEEAKAILSQKSSKKKTNYNKGPGRDYLPMVDRKGRSIPQGYERQSEYMMSKCKFKAIQWGQSVSDNERRENMKALTESIMDLSDSLGIPEDKLSINGELSLAVGARGTGLSRASAHYEPKHKIINLTRKGGSGALAHEYFHSLDNLVSKQNQKGEWMTKTQNTKVEAFQRAIYTHRKRLAEEFSGKGYSKKDFKYWVNNQQELFARCGEKFIQEKMKEKGIVNNHLCGLSKNNPNYPNDEEWVKIRPAFEALFNEIKGKL